MKKKHPSHHHPRDFRINAAVITVSDTRTETTDKTGEWLLKTFRKIKNIGKISRHIVSDDIPKIRLKLRYIIRKESPKMIIITGGTGITRRDVTPEAVLPLLDKTLSGFGEIFRLLSYKGIGPAAWFSRVLAGTIGNVIIICLPGSMDAVRTGIEKMVIPEISHLANMLEW